MLARLVTSSIRRDARKKAVAFAAVALATCLATFLLNWALNLGDKMQRELRAYGANIVVTAQGAHLPFDSGDIGVEHTGPPSYLNMGDLAALHTIFWRNQILALAPELVVRGALLPARTLVQVVGTEFGGTNAKLDLRKVSPGLAVSSGRWPKAPREAVAGWVLARDNGWRPGSTIGIEYDGNTGYFVITGTLHTGGPEDRQVLAGIRDVQQLARADGGFSQMLVSALVTPENDLYERQKRNPGSLSGADLERFSCTPYVSSVAADIQSAIPGSEARVIRRVSQSEQKISTKVNWLMLLVTLAALVASALTTASTTTGMVLERRKELALMKAIGSQNSFVFVYLVVEILVLGLVAGLAGYALGSVLSVELSRRIFETPLELKWIVLPVVMLIGSLIIVLGSLWPLGAAMKLQPSQLLKDL